MTETAWTVMGLSPHDALWTAPTALLGWQVAQHLRRQGVKGIGRRVDFGALKAAVNAQLEKNV